jgi:DNA ligase D-like protein (predicted 3'-phosphoesterase)
MQKSGVASMRFVVQEHFASHHHFDFRLEIDGIAKSWAVPKGMPEKKGDKRLGIQVEDHDVNYMDFEGKIPFGYGMGKVFIWDKGTYELLKKSNEEIKVRLNGEKLKGTYVLLKFPKGGKNAWLILKVD